MAYESFPNSAHNSRAITLAENEQLLVPLGTSGMVGYTGVAPVFADSTGRQVKIRAGVSATIRGTRFNTTSETVVSIGANSSGSPRKDLLVLRLDRAASAPNAYTISPVVIAGTPAANPVAPQPVRDVPLTATGYYDIPLCEVTVANGATTIAATNVVNRAWWVAPGGYTGFDAAKPPVEAGAFFRANDTSIAYLGTSGGSWQTIYRDTGWVTITPAAGWAHVYSGLRVRRVGNDVKLNLGVRRTGATVGTTTQVTLATLTAPFLPDGIDALGTYSLSSSDAVSDFIVRTTGQIVLNPTFNSNLNIPTDSYCVGHTSWFSL